MKQYTVKVAGVSLENRQAYVALVRAEDEVHLRWDPHNEHDPNAVQVWWSDKHIGFLPKEVAAEVAPIIIHQIIFAKVAKTLGGTRECPTYGLRIAFEIKDGKCPQNDLFLRSGASRT